MNIVAHQSQLRFTEHNAWHLREVESTEIRRLRSERSTCVVEDCRSGFTLLELVAVIVLVGLIATVSGFGFHVTLQKATARQSVELWLATDQNCRRAADSENRQIRLRHLEGSVQRSKAVGGSRAWVTLPVHLADVRVEGAHGQNLTEIIYYSNGTTQDYL
ncbi:MAG: type II secretion system protein, partial [Planctomycetaceae bacterium]|nr:type II secretion system protein [Planctomycetaceae bacterium]